MDSFADRPDVTRFPSPLSFHPHADRAPRPVSGVYEIAGTMPGTRAFRVRVGGVTVLEVRVLAWCVTPLSLRLLRAFYAYVRRVRPLQQLLMLAAVGAVE